MINVIAIYRVQASAQPVTLTAWELELANVHVESERDTSVHSNS